MLKEELDANNAVFEKSGDIFKKQIVISLKRGDGDLRNCDTLSPFF